MFNSDSQGGVAIGHGRAVKVGRRGGGVRSAAAWLAVALLVLWVVLEQRGTARSGGSSASDAGTTGKDLTQLQLWQQAASAWRGKVGGEAVHVVITDEEAKAALARLGAQLELVHKGKASDGVAPDPPCKPKYFGTDMKHGGGGRHALCESRNPLDTETPCNILSYGVERQWTFEVDVAESWNCRVVAMDPTVTYKTKLHDKVYFLPFGAPSDHPSAQKSWLFASPSRLAETLGMKRLSALKMDCEACEFYVARDVLAHDPTFFERVDNFSFEVHVSKFFMDSVETMLGYGRLLVLLERANLRYVHSEIAPCWSEHEKLGCLDELLALGYPCARGITCQNILFGRAAGGTLA